MKKILLSIGSILFAGAILAGGTGAFLGDTETSTGNTFATGVIDLKIDNQSYVTNENGNLKFSPTTSWTLSGLQGKLFFNFLDIKPGDIGEDTISLHVNNNNAYACMNVKIKGTPENGQTGPEDLVDPTGADNKGELQKYLYFSFWADDGDNVYEKGEKIFKKGKTEDIFDGANWALADANSNVWSQKKKDPILGNAVKYIGKVWCFGDITEAPVNQDGHGSSGLPGQANMNNGPLVRGAGFICKGDDVGNIVQSDGLKLNVQFSAIQSRNNSSFLCKDENNNDQENNHDGHNDDGKDNGKKDKDKDNNSNDNNKNHHWWNWN